MNVQLQLCTSNPIVCQTCGHPSWRSSWSGHFYEELTLIWQDTTQRYELGFENEDQFDTDTNPWICEGCGMEPDDETQQLITENTR